MRQAGRFASKHTWFGSFSLSIGLWMGGIGCLPDPHLTLPDFAGAPPAGDAGGLLDAGKGDASVPPAGDGGSPDLAGMGWQRVATPAARTTLRGMAATSRGDDLYIVGHDGLLLHRGLATPWEIEPLVTGVNLYAVAARGPDEVYAVGAEAVLLHRQAGRWSRETAPPGVTATLFALTILENGEVVTVGDLGTALRRTKAGQWIAETGLGLQGAALRGVWGARDADLIAVGQRSAITRYRAGSWERDLLGMDAMAKGNYYAVASDGIDLFIVGDYGLVLRQGPMSWIPERLAAPPDIAGPLHWFALATSGGEFLATGSEGTVARRVAGTWFTDATGELPDLYGAYMGSPASFVVGAQGLVLHRR